MKDLVCPPVNAGQIGVCLHECDSNEECDGEKWCCGNGCGKVCTLPVTASEIAANEKAHKTCQLMVTCDKDTEPVIKNNIPKPSNYNSMFGGAIISIAYTEETDENEEKCCKVDALLKGMSKVESVEYEGPTPACIHSNDDNKSPLA